MVNNSETIKMPALNRRFNIVELAGSVGASGGDSAFGQGF
jgi:hypothetical protein